MPSRAMRAKTSPLRGSRRRTVPCRSPSRTADPGQSSRRQRASPAFRSGPGASADPSFNLARHAAGGGGRTRQFAPASFAAASASAAPVRLALAQIAPAHSVVSNLTRPARPRRFAPRAARTVVGLPVLADRARAWRQNQDGRETTSGQKIISPRCFARAGGCRLRLPIRREALPIAEGKSISIARLRPMQDVSNSRGDGPAFGRYAGYAPETGRPRWKNQIGPRPRRWVSLACWLRFDPVPRKLASIPLHPSG